MISPSKIRIVYLKELRDILRDRRTLYSMILMPMIMYPLLSVGMGALVGSQMKKTQAAKQKIAILGEHNDPALAQAVRDLDKFEIVPLETLRGELLNLAERDSTLDRGAVEQLFSANTEGMPDSIRNPIFSRAIDERVIRAALQIPPQFTERIATGDSLELILLYDRSDAKSDAAADKLRDWALAYRDSMVTTRLVEQGLTESFIRPFWVVQANVASKERMGGLILGMMLPYLMIIMVMVGGMYPALDLTAGEKERNTLETILAAPLSRFDIAAGKFLTTFTAAMVTASLSLVSLTATAMFGFSSMASEGIVVHMSGASAFWLLFMMVPTAVLFSALMIAVAIAAKSYKEGQSYLTPLLMLVILPGMIAFVPGIELTGGLLFVPVVNLSLALKEVVLGTYKVWRIMAVFGVTAVYAFFALFVAQRIFERESVLFRT